jgi:hypothetical protein
MANCLRFGECIGHSIFDFVSQELSGSVRWIREERFIDCAQREFGTVLKQQHLGGSRADNAIFREPCQTE